MSKKLMEMKLKIKIIRCKKCTLQQCGNESYPKLPDWNLVYLNETIDCVNAHD